LAKSRKDKAGWTSPPRSGIHVVKSSEERQAYEDKVRHAASAGDTSKSDEPKREEYGGSGVDVQDKEFPSAKGARQRIEPPKKGMPDWLKVVLLAGVPIFLAIAGGIYKFARLEGNINSNTKEISKTQANVNERIGEARANIKDLVEKTGDIRERIAKLEAYTKSWEGSMNDFKKQLENLGRQLEQVENKGASERQALLEAIDEKLRSLEARISSVR